MYITTNILFLASSQTTMSTFSFSASLCILSLAVKAYAYDYILPHISKLQKLEFK